MNHTKLCLNCFNEKSSDGVCPHCGYVPGGASAEHYYLPEGTMLHDRYLVGTVLGHGGFGITYIGFDTKLDVKVAVKEYLPSEISTRALGETTVTSFSGEKGEQFEYGLVKFQDEAKTLAKFNDNTCIVSTTDFFNENNTAYLVMEYLDGISLSEYLRRSGGKLPWEDAIRLVAPVFDALEAVHDAGLIHRDISPDNIFITNQGKTKLLDFGTARFAMGEKSKSLSVILKPGYAPPEQYYSRGKQGPWTDIYSLAATLYKLITGETPPEAMERQMSGGGELELGIYAGIPGSFKKGILKALSLEPAYRQQSIRQLRENLFVTEEPAPEPPKKEEATQEQRKVSAEKPKQEEKPHEPEQKGNKQETPKASKKKILIGFAAIAAVIALFVIISVTGKQPSPNTSLSNPAATPSSSISSVLQNSSLSINPSPSAEVTQTTKTDDASEIYQKAADHYDNGELYEAYVLLKTITDYDKALSMIDEIKANVLSYTEDLVAEVEVPRSNDLTEYKDILRELDFLEEYVTQFNYYGSDLISCVNIQKGIGNIYNAVLDEYTIRFFNQLSAEKYINENYISYSIMVDITEYADIDEAFYAGSTIDIYTEESEITFGLWFTDSLQAGTYLNFTRYGYSLNTNSYAFEKKPYSLNKQICVEDWAGYYWGAFGGEVKSILNGVYCIEVYIEDDNTLIARQPFLINISS